MIYKLAGSVFETIHLLNMLWGVISAYLLVIASEHEMLSFWKVDMPASPILVVRRTASVYPGKPE